MKRLKERIMQLIVSGVKFVYFMGGFLILFSKPVYAYIDPSTITYVVQGIAAIFIAIGAAFTMYRHKIFNWIKGKKQDNHDKIEGMQRQEDNLEDEEGIVEISLPEEDK